MVKVRVLLLDWKKKEKKAVLSVSKCDVKHVERPKSSSSLCHAGAVQSVKNRKDEEAQLNSTCKKVDSKLAHVGGHINPHLFKLVSEQVLILFFFYFSSHSCCASSLESDTFTCSADPHSLKFTASLVSVSSHYLLLPSNTYWTRREALGRGGRGPLQTAKLSFLIHSVE